MTTPLPTSPFIDENRPTKPFEPEFLLNHDLFMHCVVPDPLPPLDEPPAFLRAPRPEFLEGIARRVASNIDRIGGFHENSGY